LSITASYVTDYHAYHADMHAPACTVIITACKEYDKPLLKSKKIEE